MQIHEYQAKKILQDYLLPVPVGEIASSLEEAMKISKNFRQENLVIKAQVHAGGRGKAGGVKVARDRSSLKKIVDDMIGMTIVNEQTGQEGKKVHTVYIEPCSEIKKEYYLSLVIDRAKEVITVITSTEGGMDIEKVAAVTPEKIIKTHIPINNGIRSFHVFNIAATLCFSKKQMKSFDFIIRQLFKLFVEKDACQIEINPLIVNGNDELQILDAKLEFDDNALFKHPEIKVLRDIREENIKEVEAKKYDLSYVKMNGDIGCMVNGAGLAMATMDMIELYGGKPANFLDVGGGATKDKVSQALKIILSDTNVRVVLVNIFGGIMRCDIIASGIIDAVHEIGIKVPLVLRLEGTNASIAKEILNKSKMQIIAVNSLGDAAKAVCKNI